MRLLAVSMCLFRGRVSVLGVLVSVFVVTGIVAMRRPLRGGGLLRCGASLLPDALPSPSS